VTVDRVGDELGEPTVEAKVDRPAVVTEGEAS
jgi:hypothetical protein